MQSGTAAVTHPGTAAAAAAATAAAVAPVATNGAVATPMKFSTNFSRMSVPGATHDTSPLSLMLNTVTGIYWTAVPR